MRTYKTISTTLSLMLLITTGVAQQTVTNTAAQQTAAVRIARAGYGNLPLTFELNQGQALASVKFLSRGRGYSAFLTMEGMTLSLRPATITKSDRTGNKPVANDRTHPSNQNTTVQFKLVGAARNAAVVGEDQQAGTVNYFIGHEAAKWQSNVPTYARVHYRNVYPGIDLLYYGNHRQLEYDFVVAPGANPGRIQFEISGTRQIKVDGEGNLVLQTSGGDLSFQAPVLYQQAGAARVAVRGSYVVVDATHLAFRVGAYDTTRPLVIDPVLLYSSYLGGGGSDQPAGIAVDSTGSIYVAGYTDSSDLASSATPGALATGLPHVFVAKLDSTGSNLVYLDYLGGSGQDYGFALAVNSAREVYVTGSTASSDFPTVSPFQETYPGSFNGFVARISADGSSLLNSTYLGGNATDQPSSIAIDNSGSVIVAGNTSSTNFPVTNAYQSNVSANDGGLYGNYGFLTKFSPDGSSLIYSTYFGGSSNVLLNCGNPCWPSPYSSITGVALDASGDVYATGVTNTYNFPVTSGAYLATDTTTQDNIVGFVSKFNSAGGLAYSTYFYESSGAITNLNAIAVDDSGSAYVTGIALSDGTFPITSTSICDPGVTGIACSFAFVTKFDPAGTSLLYSTFLGANNFANPVAIALDANHDAYVVASTSSSRFETTSGIGSYAGGTDILVVEIDPAASTQLFATYLGGSADDAPAGIAIDSNGNAYIAGSTDSTNFPVTTGAFQRVLGGKTDAFVVKVGAPAAPQLSLTPAALTFAARPLGSTSQAQASILHNLGTTSLTISSVAISGDFAQTNSCGTSVPAGGSCTLSVTFTPIATGTRTGALRITDGQTGSSLEMDLIGTGTAATATDFVLSSSSPNSASVKAGRTATYGLTVSPVGGAFNSSVSLTCSGLPANATCSLSPNPLATIASPRTVTVTIVTAGSVAELSPTSGAHERALLAVWIQLPGFGMLGMLVTGSKIRLRQIPTRKIRLLALIPVIALMLLMSGCAGGTGIVSQPSAGTPAGTYTVTVTGISGNLQHSLPLTLTVQ